MPELDIDSEDFKLVVYMYLDRIVNELIRQAKIRCEICVVLQDDLENMFHQRGVVISLKEAVMVRWIAHIESARSNILPILLKAKVLVCYSHIQGEILDRNQELESKMRRLETGD